METSHNHDNLAHLPTFLTLTLKIQHINDNQGQMYMQ